MLVISNFNNEQLPTTSATTYKDKFLLNNTINYFLETSQSTLSHDFDVSALFYLEQDKFVPFIKGVLCPFWAFVTLVTNTMVCIVLTSKRMLSPTNVLLVAIACSDILTGCLPVPCTLYFYASERYKEWVPFQWCFAYQCLTEFLPTIFHTSTIWLTVTLAAQRYICVCRPVRAKMFCTIPNFIKVITGIFISSFLFHSCRFFENDYIPVKTRSRLSYSSSSSFDDPDYHSDQNVEMERNVTNISWNISEINNTLLGHSYSKRIVIMACKRCLKGFINANQQTYFNVYYWSRVIFVHILPCVSLVLLNAALIGALRKASARRRRLLHYGANCDKRPSDVHLRCLDDQACEPKNCHYGIVKELGDKKTRECKIASQPFKSNPTEDPGFETQETSPLDQINKGRPNDVDWKSGQQSYQMMSVTVVDQATITNLFEIPASDLQTQIDKNKPKTKLLMENSAPQCPCVSTNLKTTSVGSAGLKNTKRSKKFTANSVVMATKTKKNKQRRQAECNCTTLMLVVVVGLFLLLEVPLAALFVLQNIDNTFELNIISFSNGQIVTWTINMLILVGYSVNFVVYCAMNREFRSTFRERIVSVIFFCCRESFPLISCQIRGKSSSSSKSHALDRSISGLYHYGKPQSRRHRSFFQMSPKNRNYIKDKMGEPMPSLT